MPQSLGSTLRELRKARDLNQFQVAEAVLGSEKRQPEVSRWEADLVKPSGHNLLALATLYVCSAEMLLRVASGLEEAAAVA